VPDEQFPHDPADQELQAAIGTDLGGGAMLVGNAATLASGFGVSVAALRVVLRELLEERRIAVNLDDRGHLTLHLERRASQRPPLMIERRRPKSDIRPL